jgi:hypothetical protein
VTKWVTPLIRRGSVVGFMPEAGEVDGAGGVEGFLGGAGRRAGEQDGVLVACPGGGVDREPEGMGGASVAEPAQRDLLAAGEDPGDVGEPGPAGDLDPVELGPVLFRVVEEPQGDRAAGGLRDGGHVPYCAARQPRRWIRSLRGGGLR